MLAGAGMFDVDSHKNAPDLLSTVSIAASACTNVWVGYSRLPKAVGNISELLWTSG